MQRKKLLYIEINRKTKEITNINKYITVSNHIDVMTSLEDDNYIGYIVDVTKYTKEYKHLRPTHIPMNVHSVIISKNRINKIKVIKNKINGASI